MSARHSKGKLSNNLHLSARRKKNRGENFKRKRLKENPQSNHAVQWGFERGTQMAQLLKQDVRESQKILINNPVGSSNFEASLNTFHQPISFASIHLPYAESSCGVQIKQECDQGIDLPNEPTLPSINYSFSLNSCKMSESNLETNLDSHQQSLSSLNHFPISQEVDVEQVPNQESFSSSENFLPSIKNSFTLTPMGTSDSPTCSTTASNKDSSETRLDLLGKNWAEKMKSLSNDQRIYAEKLINDVFFLAELGRLKHVCGDGSLWLKVDK